MATSKQVNREIQPIIHQSDANVDYRTAKVLLVEDSAFDENILRHAIGDMANITVVTSGKATLEALSTGDFDVLLLDIMLPDMDGFELCRQIKERQDSEFLPIIFITSLDDCGSEEHGLKLGAADYISKPIVPSVVNVRVRNHVAFARTNRELRKVNEKLSLLAATDPLTGVFNRRQFESLATEKSKQAAENNENCCFLMLDLDHFKAVNDNRGHAAGDAVLRAVAKVWGEALRPWDILGRVGGEEFSVLLPNTTFEQGLRIAERLCHLTAQMDVSIDGETFNITASIGLAHTVAGKRSWTELSQEADLALYDAKNGGRNCVCHRITDAADSA